MHFTLFDSPKLVDEFDEAPDTRGLILDVRFNWGGNTGVAEDHGAGLSHGGWQHALDGKAGKGAGLSGRWTNNVSARGPWTSIPSTLVVVVNHWSESMAEGVAMGLDGMKRARIVGTRMAGMGAGVEHHELPKSRHRAPGLSAESHHHVNGEPRSDFRPPVEVRLDTPEALSAKDPILDAGVAELQRLLASASP